MSLANSAKKAATRRGAEPDVTWTAAQRLEPGQYRAYCRSAKIYRDRGFGRWVCPVQFDILDANLMVVGRLPWFLNMGTRERPHAGRRSKYFLAWVKANGGPPARRDRLTPQIFMRRYAMVEVGDTVKNFAQQPVTSDFAYSVVRSVLEWETGPVGRTGRSISARP
jgi:hypothetical protein